MFNLESVADEIHSLSPNDVRMMLSFEVLKGLQSLPTQRHSTRSAFNANSSFVCFIESGLWQPNLYYSQFIEICGHLFNLSVVVILDLLKEASILRKNKVDSGSLSTETTGATDSVDVVLFLHGKLVIDDKTDLLDVDTSGEQVSGDKDSDSTGSELLHHDFTLLLVHFSVHAGNDEILFGHRALKLINSLFSVTINDSLLDI